MAYSNTVTVISLEGGTWPSVTTRLWMLWTTVGGPSSGPQQMEQDSIEMQSAGSFVITSNLGPSNADVSRGIGLSLQDTNRVAKDEGWWFRSGRFEGDLPTDPIEIVLASPLDILAADVPALLPTPPFPIDGQTDVTSLSVTLAQGGLDFTAVGTTTKTGVVIGFTYGGRLILSPSPSIAQAESEALSVGIANAAISFQPGPSVLSAIQAELLNLLRVFIMRELGPQVRTQLERRVNTAVIASVGRSLPGGVLPPGVILSIRSVSVTPVRIQVRAALGAFGGVFTNMPTPGSGGSTRPCFIATAASGAHAPEVAVLRSFRDSQLLTTPAGRRVVRLYERLSPAAARVIAKHRSLRVLARDVVVRPAAAMATRRMRRGSVR